MNRLHQLKETLPQNLIDNDNYEDLEFIILDYNSQDDIETWIRTNMAEHIRSGRLIYYKTNQPVSWDPSHSKNVAFKLASGDILCSIWADHYTGENFAEFVNTKFNNDDDIVLTPIDFQRPVTIIIPPEMY